MEAAVWNVRLPRVLMRRPRGRLPFGGRARRIRACSRTRWRRRRAGRFRRSWLRARAGHHVGLSSACLTPGRFRHEPLDRRAGLLGQQAREGGGAGAGPGAGRHHGELAFPGRDLSFIKLAADPTNKLPQITHWLTGQPLGHGLGGPRLRHLADARRSCAALSSALEAQRPGHGRRQARAMGVDAGRLRIWLIIAATLVTAASVSVSA